MMSSANGSYQFSRQSKLSKSARALNKQELSRSGSEWLVNKQEVDGSQRDEKWRSTATLAVDSGEQDDGSHSTSAGNKLAAQLGGNFDRLKKSYATMRKSFRLQLTESSQKTRNLNNHRVAMLNSQPEVEDDYMGEESGGKRRLMGRVGSGAAKLLRNAYRTSRRRATGDNLDQDSIHCTDGSFKVLSSLSSSAASWQVKPAAECRGEFRPRAKKSIAELELELRLRRSRGRVLPSAQYKAPGSEKACDGLNMDELEEIRRDNLRLKLADSSQRQPNVISKVEETDEKEPSGSDAIERQERVACSCKRLDCCSESSLVAETTKESGDTNYCSCVSLSSSFSSISRLSLVSLEDDCLIGIRNNLTSDQNSSRPQTGDNESRRPLESRALSGDDDNQLIEDKLKFMFDSMGHKLLFLSDSGTVNEATDSENSISDNDNGDLVDGNLVVATRGANRDSWTEATSQVEKSSSRNSEQADDCCGFSGSCLSLGGVLTTDQKATSGQQLDGQSSGNNKSGEPQEQTATGLTSEQVEVAQSFPKGTTTTTTNNNKLHAIGSNGNQMQSSAQFACGSRRQQIDGQRKFEKVTASRLQSLDSDNQLQFGKTSDRSTINNTITTRYNTKRVDGSNKDAAGCNNKSVDDQISSRYSTRTNSRRLKNKTQEPEVMKSDSWRQVRQQQEAEMYDEEHVYASIRTTQDSNENHQFHEENCDLSDDNNHNQFHHLDYYQSTSPRFWQEQMQKDCLFDRQFNGAGSDKRASDHQAAEVRAKQKRPSLFSRLKRMIVPQENSNNNNDEKVSRVNELKSGDKLTINYEELEAAKKLGGMSRRRQKAATLSSRSTQNLRQLPSNRKWPNPWTDEQDLDEYEDYQSHNRRLTNGFLTLGRRGIANRKNFEHDDEGDGKRNYRLATGGGGVAIAADRFGGSADSLPSADSGLSCGNLQNSGSSDDNRTNHYATGGNLYSRGPTERRLPAGANNRLRRVVGMARAKVDCNPCAYDKEALVFSAGDLIEILERNQSGTWVGRSNGQVGHFKFINVTEIVEDENPTQQQQKSGGREQQRVNGTSSSDQYPADGSGLPYVTKLEIRSNQSEGQRRATSHYFDHRRSMSMGTISSLEGHQRATNNEPNDDEQLIVAGDDDGKQQVAKLMASGFDEHSTGSGSQRNPISGSNETIMSSLEQLLVAIGLASEQVATKTKTTSSLTESVAGTDRKWEAENRDQSLASSNQLSDQRIGMRVGGKLTATTNSCDGRAIGDCSEQSPAAASCLLAAKKRSYLDLLSSGGVRSLDSFSAIENLHELKQMGIVDDEHQRRLLMAARIIRQASQAAKLEFLGNTNHQSNSRESTSATTRERATRDNRVMSQATGEKGLQQQQSIINEPIYVNLLRSNGDKHQLAKVHGYDRRELVADRFDRRITKQQKDIRPTGSKCSQRSLQRRVTQSNSINQPFGDDHYRAGCCAATRTSSVLDTSFNTVESEGYYDDYYDYNDDCCVDDDNGGDYVEYEADCGHANDFDSYRQPRTNLKVGGRGGEFNVNLPLTRGYSARANHKQNTTTSSNHNVIDITTSKCSTPTKQFNTNQRRDLSSSGKRQPGSSRSRSVRLSTTSCWTVDEVGIHRLSSVSPVDDRAATAKRPVVPPPPIRRRAAEGGVSIRRRQQQPEDRTMIDEGSYDISVKNATSAHLSHMRQSQNSGQSYQRPFVTSANHQHQYGGTNLGSQINSKSAYDLRLDLSHFFS